MTFYTVGVLIERRESFFFFGRFVQTFSPPQVLELVMEVDLNGDGTIDFQEFLQMMKKKSSETDQMEVTSLIGPLSCHTDPIVTMQCLIFGSRVQLLQGTKT